MGQVREFWRSSIGGKVTMAVTGALLFLFVIAHLLGNLNLFAGPQALADYAAFLHGHPPMLWSARIGLLLVFSVHVATAVRLSAQNRAARPVGYAMGATVQATFASRSMVFSGLTLLVFIVYHLLHFTVGAVHHDDVMLRERAFGGYDVHAMVVASFSHPLVVFVYVLGQVVLFLHLRHGVQSFLQTLGLHHARWFLTVRTLSLLVAAAIAGGNTLLALSVLLGLVK